MTSKFDDRDRHELSAIDSNEMNNQHTRFELLSAYLDGEVTAAERKQIQEWLDTDPKMQQLYHRLLRLRQEMTHLSIPPSPQSSEQLSDRVFQSIDRRRNQQFYLWGGAAIAAMVIGVVSHLFLGNNSLVPQVAENPEPPVTEPLMVALNHPVVEIPPMVEENKENEKITDQATKK